MHYSVIASGIAVPVLKLGSGPGTATHNDDYSLYMYVVNQII